MSTPREVAVRRIHHTALTGAIFAAVPLPFTTSGLSAMEVRLGAFIASSYGQPLPPLQLALGGLGLSFMGRGLKAVARGVGSRLPAPFGLVARMVVAAATIELLGHGLVLVYEARKG
ncbi:MAG: hypothetical protein WKG00_12335 [Polyangiaceae bacterium]